jgi:TP901 family phage tail tape measure protein
MGFGFTFTTRDLASAGMRNVERSYMSLDEKVGAGSVNASFKALGVGMGVFAAGALTVAGAFGLANMAADFEQAIAAVGAVSGASAKELDQLRDAAIDAGNTTRFSPTEATVGLQELAQAGFNAKESITMLTPVLGLAAGSLGELSPQAAAGLAAQAMKAFGIAVDDAGPTVDRMLQAVNVFALNASELPLALGTASRGAITLNQTLSETLIALGLVKNVIPGVERASTAVAVAMERMVKPEVQKALDGLGVKVLGAGDKFRPFLDVLGDLAPALDKMTQAQRSAFLLKTFGGEALGGVNAILTQMTNGIRSNTGETLKGAAALKYLRTQFDEAGGTAKNFADKMLDTFAGQKQLMRGSLETLGILLGQPFAQVFKPIVGMAVDALNSFLKVLRGTPMSVKRAFAGFLVGAGAVVMLLGAIILAVTVVAIFAETLETVAIALLVLSGALIPAAAAAAMLGVVVAGLYVAFRDNLGGVGDLVQRIGTVLRLFFGGLAQLVEQGGFSGALRAELNKAENLGLKHFLISVWQVVYRLQRIWEGFTEGFTATIQAAAPIFEELSAAVSELGDEIGQVFSDILGDANALPSERFSAFGASIGEVFGKIATAVVVSISLITRFASGFLQGVRSVWSEVEPAFSALGEAIGEVVEAFGNLFGITSMGTSVSKGATTGWGALGAMLGRILARTAAGFAWGLGAALRFVAYLVNVAAVIVDVFYALVGGVEYVATALDTFFTETLPAAAASAVAFIVTSFSSLLAVLAGFGRRFLAIFGLTGEGIRSFLAPVFDFFDGVGDKLLGALTRIRDVVIGMLRALPRDLLPTSLATLAALPLSTESGGRDDPARDNTAAAAASAAAASSAMPAAADAGARADQTAVLQAALAASSTAQGPVAPITVNMVVDGEVLARASYDANKDAAGRSFSPVASY